MIARANQDLSKTRRELHLSSLSGPGSLIAPLSTGARLALPTLQDNIFICRSDGRVGDSRTGFFTTPTIFRLVSKDLPRFLDRKQSFLRPERSLVRNIRENLGQQRLTIPLHYGISIRNNEYVRAFDLCFQGKTNRLGRITGINVTPEIPFAFPGIILKPRESRIIMGFHDIRKTQPDNL